ncbi:hypothetical protein JOF53_007978 [Crossiella equi]|uniref:Major capsid protein n=1 Tax=Crossiella equi TaxID=130796 RepID=A0ABS5ARQ7_9PSEU|nr:P22 phage major capsid protein family protein [Crossiella equi]MBP2479106.1 hypothetical protein [Crossiella equi]
MPNTILTPRQIAAASLAALERQAVLAGTTWRDAERDFAGKIGDTVTVRTGVLVGRARRFNRAAGAPIVIDDITEHAVDVKLTDYLYKGVALTDEELTLKLRDFTTTVSMPQAKSVAEEVETMVAAQMNALASTVTIKPDGSDINLAILNARKVLTQNGVPFDGRFLAVSPDVEVLILDHLSKKLVNTADSTWSTALREAVIGRLHGFNVLPSAYLADGSAVAYHSSAFPLVTRALSVPEGATFGESMTYNGISLRLIRDYDPGFQQDRSVVSTLAGASTTKEEDNTVKRAVRLTVSATP